MNIVPRHPRSCKPIGLVRKPMVYLSEICYTRVVVVLARKQLPGQVVGMRVAQWCIMGVPSAETNVEPSNARHSIVANNDLEVMRPIKHDFAASMIRMSHDGDVFVQVLEKVFGMFRAHGHALGDFLVHNDADLDSLLGFPQEKTVEPPFLVLTWWTSKVEFGSQPPIKNEDGIFCLCIKET